MAELRKIESARLRGEADCCGCAFRSRRGTGRDVLLRIYLAWCAFPAEDAWNQLKAISAIYPENPGSTTAWAHLHPLEDEGPGGDALATALKATEVLPAMIGQAELLVASDKLEEAQARYRSSLSFRTTPRAAPGWACSVRAGKKQEARDELLRAWRSGRSTRALVP